jgi:N6-adenosine-specific RNA methylase IME4
MKFGTLLVDPPWNYARASSDKKLSGYCSDEYPLMTTADLCGLPVGELGSDDSVLLMWATWPFLPDALQIMEAWDYSYVTGLTWVKTLQNVETVAYGVGYWFRGATELVLVGRRKKAMRTAFIGLGGANPVDGYTGPRLDHSRKPSSIYQVAEEMPGPRLEIFARHQRPGWYSLGNECPGDGLDIRQRLDGLAAGGLWSEHLMPLP